MTDETIWSLIDFSEPRKRGGEQSPPLSVECPKCGKKLKKRGAHFHIRACKGDESD